MKLTAKNLNDFFLKHVEKLDCVVMLSIGTHSQQDLLYCIDGLGKASQVIDNEGNTITIYEKGPEALGTCFKWYWLILTIKYRMYTRFTTILKTG